MKSARRKLAPSALELIEEAVHLLRGAPAGTLAVYYAGTAPFVLALLFFWAHTTWFQPSGDTIAWSTLGLVGLFGIMKAAHAEFCARLLAQRLGAPPPASSWRRFARLFVAQMRLQPWALLGSVPAALLTIPFGWVYAYAQSVTVLGDDERLHHEASQQAKLWPQQNHVGLLLLSVLAFGTWFNLGAAFAAVPWLANRLLGIDNLFGFSGFWFLNTTFVASVTGLTWLAVDPLVRAFYTLRVFHGRARRTGEDVRVELRQALRAPAVLRAATLAAVLLFVPTVALRGGDAPPPAAVQPAPLDRAIDEVLASSDFRWRLRATVDEGAPKRHGPIARFMRKGADLVRDTFRAIGDGLRAVVRWLERTFFRGRGERPGMPASGALAIGALRVLLYAFIAIAVLLLLWLIWLVVRGARRNAAPVLAATAVTDAKPDLRDENIQAAQLPAEGWLALAREQAARGEWRLAWRALYLATLTRLAAEGLVSLAKFKTNLDYERELRRRALSRADLIARFARRRREFEDVWYGRAEPGEPGVRAWLAELEGSVPR